MTISILNMKTVGLMNLKLLGGQGKTDGQRKAGRISRFHFCPAGV
jgi:hypothetical protein